MFIIYHSVIESIFLKKSYLMYTRKLEINLIKCFVHTLSIPTKKAALLQALIILQIVSQIPLSCLNINAM